MKNKLNVVVPHTDEHVFSFLGCMGNNQTLQAFPFTIHIGVPAEKTYLCSEILHYN